MDSCWWVRKGSSSPGLLSSPPLLRGPVTKSQYLLRSMLTALALARTRTHLPLGTCGTALGPTAQPRRCILAPPCPAHCLQALPSLPLRGHSWSQALFLCKEAWQHLPLAQVTRAQYQSVTCGITLPITPKPKRPLQAPWGRCTALRGLWHALLSCFLQGCTTFPFPLHI